MSEKTLIKKASPAVFIGCVLFKGIKAGNYLEYLDGNWLGDEDSNLG
jgi:hypothetical protein